MAILCGNNVTKRTWCNSLCACDEMCKVTVAELVLKIEYSPIR